MRDNIEQASAFKIRHTAPRYNTLTTTLTAAYTISADSPNVLFLDPGASVRDIYLPAIVPGGGQEIKIFNIGTLDLTIRDAGGVSLVVLALGEASEFNSYDGGWKYFKHSGASGAYAPDNADYLVKTANATLTAERVVTDGAAAGTAVWDWSVAGTVKASLYASAADKMLYSTGANAWAEAAITAAGRALIDDANAAAQLVTLGAAASGANTDITSLYLNNTGLKIKDTNASHGLIIAPGSDITADRTLTVTTGDANRTLTISASATISQDYSSTGNPQFATIELGAASDTTLSRSSAGVIAVEGVTVPLNSTTNTHTAQQIELGHASDTTLSRSSAGVLAVEGVTVPLNSITNIHTAQQIELGHASDTTIARVSAGIAAIEGSNILTASTGIAQGKRTIWIPASAMVSRTTNGPSIGTVEMTTNKNMVRTLDFDSTTQEFAQFEIAMPKSWNESTVTFQPVWSHPSTTTNFGVVWALQAVATSDDDTLDVAFGTEQTSTDTGGTTNDRYIGPESSAITIGGSPAEGDVVQFQIKRNPSDGSDTMAVDARLHGIKLYITLNASTDA